MLLLQSHGCYSPDLYVVGPIRRILSEAVISLGVFLKFPYVTQEMKLSR